MGGEDGVSGEWGWPLVEWVSGKVERSVGGV